MLPSLRSKSKGGFMTLGKIFNHLGSSYFIFKTGIKIYAWQILNVMVIIFSAS